MASLAPIAETTHEPRRHRITGLVKRAKRIAGILPVARSGATEPKPAAPALQEPANNTGQQIRRFPRMPVKALPSEVKQWKFSRMREPGQKKK